MYGHAKDLDTSKNNFEKEQVGGLTLCDFKTYCNATIIKIMWYCSEGSPVDQWNGRESRNRSIHVWLFCFVLFFDRDAKVTWWGNNLFRSSTWTIE